jgi:hypothetical protein
MNNYDANSIKILGARALEEKFPFHRIQALATKYPYIPRSHISRIVEAACLVDWDYDSAEQRYLVGDKSILVPEEFKEAFKELADQRR